MRLLLILSAAFLMSCLSTKTSTVQSAEFQVKGVCGECEERIERAALMPGVRSAEWDRYTEVMKVIYVPTKVSLEEIHNSIAAVGHDTDKVKASDEVYSALPKCCWYRDGAEKH